MHTSYGDMEVAIPGDRKGEYEPQGVKKYQNTGMPDMEEKTISMYAKDMTTGDNERHMKELYDIDISDSTISFENGSALFLCINNEPCTGCGQQGRERLTFLKFTLKPRRVHHSLIQSALTIITQHCCNYI